MIECIHQEMNLIESWLQSLKTNYIQLTTMYGDKMSELLKKTPVTILELNPDKNKKKRFLFLHVKDPNGK